jgi:Holliday junction DNA helicase RuvA
MIARIEGKVLFAGPSFLIVDVGGLGYKVFVTGQALEAARREDRASLWTHLAVREDALDLFGFEDRQELELFEMLIGVPGIGPKSALAILNLMPVSTLRSAIASGETAYLTKVSGIGKKSAEKIVLELRDKLGAAAGESDDASFKEKEEALEALVALGYSLRDAREALKKVGDEHSTLSEKVREALKVLSEKR